MTKIRLIAYYLPQFHPIPENDKWWGKGFTEWTNVAKAKPLFKGHIQPKIPADLGFYDLRLPEIREKQAELAEEHKIDGFCYWHYWFGNGKKLLNYPIEQVLVSKKPKFPFCFAWANQTWGGLPYGDGFDRILIKQNYLGKQDIVLHYNYIRKFFLDERYLKINNKPFFQINTPIFEDSNIFIEIWNELSLKDGFDGIYFIAHALPVFDYKSHNYSAISFVTPLHLFNLDKKNYIRKLYNKLKQKIGILEPTIYDYKRLLDLAEIEYEKFAKLENKNFLPVAIPNWDHSPRSKRNSSIILNGSPNLFYRNLEICKKLIMDSSSEGIILIKAWNEWAEGNYLEPDIENGCSYLEVCKKFKSSL